MSNLQKIVVLCVVGGAIVGGGFFVLSNFTDKEKQAGEVKDALSNVYIPEENPTTIHLLTEEGDEIILSVEDLPKESEYLGPCFGTGGHPCTPEPGQIGAYLHNKWFASAVLSPDGRK